MTSQGELVFRQLVVKLSQRVSTRYITGHEVQKICKFFWPLLSEDFKTGARGEHGRQAFWGFAQFLKDCLINNHLDYINDLWPHVDANGKHLFEHFYENALNSLVGQVL